MKKYMAILCLILFTAPALAQTTRIVAHRGYWKTGGAAQNSIAALENAAAGFIYGSEFDVNVTRDGVPIIFHDDRIGRRVIEKHDYSAFRNHTLSNGEKVPTLEQYLNKGAEYPAMRLVLEIKSASSPAAETRAVERIIALVRQSPARGQVEFIAFSLHVVKEILRIEPGARVAYLNGDLSPDQLHELVVPGLDYNLKVIRRNPDWVARAHELGMFVNVWTVNKREYMKWLADLGVDFITTDEPLLLNDVLTSR